MPSNGKGSLRAKTLAIIVVATLLLVVVICIPLRIVVLSRLLGSVTRRIGQPMVIAEITAGILLGPSLLGWIHPETTGV